MIILANYWPQALPTKPHRQLETIIQALFLSLFTVILITYGSFCRASESALLDGATGKVTNLRRALSGVRAGDVLILGEQHGTRLQPQRQIQIMQALRERGLLVSVGMEFLEYPNQHLVEQYRLGKLSESDFLARIAWGKGFPFSSYRGQILFPDLRFGKTLALNVPRQVASHIAKTGEAGLTHEERALLPADFTLGNPHYRERFREVMGDHLPNPEAFDNYFVAQSAWDDTMAWQASDFMSKNPGQVLVIIVGEFHVQYGGGLPDRLRQRLPPKTQVLSFSLLNSFGWGPKQEQLETEISPKWGQRSDYIWLIPEARQKSEL